MCTDRVLKINIKNSDDLGDFMLLFYFSSVLLLRQCNDFFGGPEIGVDLNTQYVMYAFA